jgi:hypothetical protein
VYNSAFMNMMRDEENAKYRSVIKNTIEFDPDILKRYVNFMSNPDERTAIDQFGNGDKCFGVATMMATLPGLPMFGHGQIEGFTEKYGMEFRRARYQEDPDPGLVARHDREIAPLLHQRWLFAESQNFLLFDFYRPDGSVDENVFAYSNRRGDHRALVVYHNRFASTYGTIHQSASYADKGAGQLRNQSLGSAFGWPNDSNVFLGFRDITTGLEHLERSSKLVSNGYSVELHAYNCHVYLDWRELRPDGERRWDLLCDHLNGRGVRSLDEALLELEVAPLHHALLELLQPEVLEGFARLDEAVPACGEEATSSTPAGLLMQKIETLSTQFAREGLAIYARKTGTHAPAKDPWPAICRQVHAAAGLTALEGEFAEDWTREARMVLPSSEPELYPGAIWGPVLATCVLHGMAETVGGKDAESTALALFDRLRLREPMARAFSFGEINEDGWRAAARVRLAFFNQTLSPKESFAGLPTGLWEDGDARWLLKVHESAGDWYFNKELHEQILWWVQLPELLELAAPAAAVAVPAEKPARGAAARNLHSVEEIEQRVDEAIEQAQEAGYRLGKKKAVKTSKREKGALAK